VARIAKDYANQGWEVDRHAMRALAIAQRSADADLVGRLVHVSVNGLVDHAALDLGMDFIDVAPYYGLTKAETVLGSAPSRTTVAGVSLTVCGWPGMTMALAANCSGLPINAT
jgi:hypothetical protein